jgi:NADH-quinone oxidoreductase subunit N
MAYSLGKSLFPELVLTIAAAILFLMGTSRRTTARKAAPVLALIALAIALVSQIGSIFSFNGLRDPWQSLQITEMARYIKLVGAGIGILLTLLAWPTNKDATSGPAIHFGTECGEFFALLLLSIVGLFLVAGANDMMLLFLGIELASLPTYIMVSISRPLPVAQEAGVKYFFLGALAAALMLFGFSYLYGTTGTIYLHGGPAADGTILGGVDNSIQGAHMAVTPWQMFALVILITGFAFKMVTVPLQVYAADVYQGAATPVTAVLSFVPKASGFVALLKVLYAVGGDSWSLPPEVAKLIWWIAILTMSFGNVLGLLQQNIKRVLAYSSIAHSGYMLVGVAALLSAGDSASLQEMALRGVLFYLAAYGLTNIAAFGVLILLPGRTGQPGTSAETFEEIAGLGRNNVALGLAMSVACFSLIGIPLTVGFIGKVLLIQPALQAGLFGLVVILVLNSAVSAVYYLRIVATLFLRPVPAGPEKPATCSFPISAAILCSVAGMLLLGAVVPCVNRMVDRAASAAELQNVTSTPQVTSALTVQP